MLTVAEIRPATAGEWDDAVARSTCATFYHTRAWAEAVAAPGNLYRPHPLAVTFSDGALAVVPFSRQRMARGLLLQLVSSPMGTYGGWLGGEDLTDEHARLLAGVLVDSATNVWWRLNPLDGAALSVAPEAGAEVTQALDLSPGPEPVIAGFNSNAARAIRRAERAGAVVRPAATADDWNTYYSMYEETARRWSERGRALYDRRLFAALERLGRDGVQLWLAEGPEGGLAGMVCLSCGSHTSYWHGASRDEGLKIGANALLIREIARATAAAGRRWFDLNPSGGLEGVTRFKSNFGPVELPAPVVVTSGRMLRVVRASRRLVHRRTTAAATGAELRRDGPTLEATVRPRGAARSLHVVEVGPATAGEWDQAMERCPYATFFQSRTWAEVMAGYAGRIYSPRPLAVRFSDGRRAVLPLTRQQMVKGLVRQNISSPMGTYGGWLAGEDITAAHADLLAGVLLDSATNVWWRLNPFDPTVEALDLPVTCVEHTHAIDLTPGFESVERGMRHGHRSSARKAEREGVAVRRARNAADWEAYYAAYVDSLRRWGVPRHEGKGWRLFEILRAVGEPTVSLWVAEWHGAVIAGALCFTSGSHTVCWHAASLEEAMSVRPATLVVREAIRGTCESGVCRFDFNPSDGLGGVETFKRRFGAEPCSCPVVVKRGGLLLAAAGAKRVAHRLRRVVASARSGSAKRYS